MNFRYYQKFIKNHDSLAQLLSDLIKKDISDRTPWQSHHQYLLIVFFSGSIASSQRIDDEQAELRQFNFEILARPGKSNVNT
ncbi:hypothetical protein QYM36_019754 [Artemia franciscana]|uniref:Uncharacterized protein n=1 Tax=Artemia franciscana TaxID=6661 RepID=A0AA88KT33_ARTSF|nr:hypothetical protein QYM36_019754 [Artemia franciscana]